MSIKTNATALVAILGSVLLTSCSTFTPGHTHENVRQSRYNPPPANYESRLPQHLATREKTILVDPNVHAWGAYDSNGDLIKAGLVSAGASYCPDIHRPCKTRSGTYHIESLGSASCKSHIFPIGHPGAPMPYCMFFDAGQALHGSYELAEANISHGCVRMHVDDAEWIRLHFANIGTKVIVKPY